MALDPHAAQLGAWEARAHIALEVAQRPLDRGAVRRGQQHRAAALAPRLGAQRAERREHAGLGREQHDAAAQGLRDRAGVQAPRAAECDQRGIARIVPALDRDLAQSGLDPRLGHQQHAFGGLRRPAGAECRRELRHRIARRRAIERERAARERIPRDTPERDQRIGHGRRAFAPVARRSRIGPRALRAHVEQAARVHPGDRAAARAHGVHVEQRQQQRVAPDLARAPPWQLALHERAVGRCAADVERERALEPACARNFARSCEPRSRAREELPCGLARGLIGRSCTTVREHDLEPRAARTLQRLDVARDARHEVGVGDGGREALVLADLGAQLRRYAHAEAGAPQRPRQRALVGGIGVGVKQPDRDGVGARALHGAHGARKRGARERDDALPPGAESLAHADPAFGGHQRLDAARSERVDVGPLLPADLEQILETGGGEERHARALALEQRVGGDGGAVPHAGLGPRAESGEALEHGAFGRIGR